MDSRSRKRVRQTKKNDCCVCCQWQWHLLITKKAGCVKPEKIFHTVGNKSSFSFSQFDQTSYSKALLKSPALKYVKYLLTKWPALSSTLRKSIINIQTCHLWWWSDELRWQGGCPDVVLKILFSWLCQIQAPSYKALQWYKVGLRMDPCLIELRSEQSFMVS